ncbi:MAG: fructosamine kinase family protein [Myxococcales bacterium]|nr:fructosamine kinase family protein [Myxococcales bacterium]
MGSRSSVDTELWRALTQTLGSEPRRAQPLSGGDINQACRLELADGRKFFVKYQRNPPAGLFEREAEGLRWLAEADALRLPEVLACGDDPPFLALEWIEPGPPAADHDERLGRGLSALHRHGAPSFGLACDNYIAILAQSNLQSSSWPAFYRSQRLEPQLRLAVDHGRASRRLRSLFEQLWPKLEARSGPAEPPARLHGDLWAGNSLSDASGQPVLIDPAVYGGHREIDLAMMRLFGGFSERCFAAYEEAFPLAEGHRERVGLYQLYPLMVHVNLFGGGYAGRVERILERIV